MTCFSGRPETLVKTYVRMSTGLATMMWTALGACLTICGMMDLVMSTLTCASSRRVCPGLRAMPEVRMTMSESCASWYPPA